MDTDPFDHWYEEQLTIGGIYVKSDWDYFIINHDADSGANVQEKRISAEKIDDWIIGLVRS